MAADSENKIVTAPLSVTEVKAVLGEDKDSVGGLCVSANVNQWSRYKPIYKAYLDAMFHFRASGYTNSLHGLKAVFYTTLSELGRAVREGSMKDWTYDNVALSLQTTPKRLGDFDGYYHLASPPFAGFYAPPELSTMASGLTQQAYLLEGKQNDTGDNSPTAPGSIRLGQIEMTAPGIEPKTLDRCYFGVVLIKSDGTAIWAKTETALIDGTTGEIVSHTYSVNMDVGDVPAGEYYAVPFLSWNAVNNISSTPGKLCLVPGCMTVRLTVASSVVTREDVDVIITRCSFSFLSGSSTQGIIRTTVSVVSKATYAKHCTYKIYISPGDGTQASPQSGSFGLPANGTQTINYNPASTAGEAKASRVSVEVSTQRADGSPQALTATAVPLVPDVSEI